MMFVISFFPYFFSYWAEMAIEATKEQSETTVCLTAKQSAEIPAEITVGFGINSSGRLQDVNLFRCFEDKLKFPCLSVKGTLKANFSLKI